MHRIEGSRNAESPLARMVIQEMAPAHTDERRTITEFQDSEREKFGNMKVISVNQPTSPEGFRLGNHHHSDIELFFLERGRIDTMVLQDPQTGEKEVYKDIAAGTKIILPPGVAHLLIFKDEATLLAFSENPFNPNNLIPYKVDY